MKKLILLTCSLVPYLIYSQQIYNWNLSSGAWNNPASWTPARNSPAPDDILRFPIDATVNDMPAIESLGKIEIINNAKLSINSATASIISIGNGSVTAPHFYIESGSKLDVSGTPIIEFDIVSGASGIVDGHVSFSNSSHKLVSWDPNSLLFRNGALFLANTGFTGNAFGISHLNSVIFQSGATYQNKSGGNPFGAAQPSTVINFQSGSTYIHQLNTAMSVAGRVYGNVEIAANSSYNLALNGDWIIQNDLRLNGFNFSFNPTLSSGALKIYGDIICTGAASLTLGTFGNSNQVQLLGNNQSIGGGGGTGNITIQNILFNNHQTSLQRPILINGVAELREGKIISSASALISFSSSSSIITCDHNYSNLSYTNMGCDTAYIEGPVKKTGLNPSQTFAFPLGKNGKLRPLILHEANGDFIAEYFRSDPTILGASMGSGIDHISRLEYWNLSGSSSAKVELTFFDPNSGGVTDMNALRIARYDGAAWIDQAVSANIGTAGSNGSVTSGSMVEWGPITLAGALGYPNNPLPIRLIYWKALCETSEIILQLCVAGNLEGYRYKIEKSEDGILFSKFYGATELDPLQNKYSIRDAYPVNGWIYYRLQILDNLGRQAYSAVTVANYEYPFGIQIYPNPCAQKLFIKLPTSSSISHLRVVNTTGSLLQCFEAGYTSLVSIDLTNLPAGTYFIEGWTRNAGHFIRKFVKY